MNYRHQYWEKLRGKMISRKGGLIIEKGAFLHGYDINRDLMGNFSYFQVLILSATGRIVPRELADWFEAVYIGMSYPDPRLWCNQVGAFGGTMRTSVVAATSAGILTADSRTYAQGTIVNGMEFIQGALRKQKQGFSVDQIVISECEARGGRPTFTGYARPLAKGDERIAGIEKVRVKKGFEIGEHLSLAFEIEKFLLQRFGESMNFNGYVSAFLSDQCFTPQESYHILAVLVAGGVISCFDDTLSRPRESFFPLHCEDIDYQGPPPREVPDVSKRK